MSGYRSDPIGMYLRDIYARYEETIGKEMLRLLEVVRRGTFPRNSLVIKKAGFLRVSQKDKGHIEIEAPKAYLVRLGNMLKRPTYSPLIKQYDFLSNKKASIELIPGAAIDFEVANRVGRFVKDPYLAPEKNLYLRLRNSEAMKARDKVVYGSLPFVVRLAERHNSSGYLDDLVSEGAIALLKAIDHFDPKRHTCFLTCATSWIRRSIRSFFRSNAKSFKMDGHDYEKMRFVEKLERRLTMEKGIVPSDEELCQEIDMLKKQGRLSKANLRINLEKVHFFRKLIRVENISISQLDEESDEGSNVDIISRDKPLIDRIIENEEALRLSKKLGSRNVTILKRRYLDSMFQREIGAEQGVTRQRIKELEERTIGRWDMLMEGR